MTADDLARFIQQIRDTGVLTGEGFQLLHVKFGDSIDQDDNGSCKELDELWPYDNFEKRCDWYWGVQESG